MITTLKLRLKSLFYNWKNIPLIKQKPLSPGLYIMKSKCWGLKGLIGNHQWFYIVDQNHQEFCLEITDLETVIFQQASYYRSWGNPTYDKQKTIILSNRNGTAFWFGNKPKVVCKLNCTFDDLIQACNSKPLKKYHILLNNCNHFVDYVKKAIQQRQPL